MSREVCRAGVTSVAIGIQYMIAEGRHACMEHRSACWRNEFVRDRANTVAGAYANAGWQARFLGILEPAVHAEYGQGHWRASVYGGREGCLQQGQHGVRSNRVLPLSRRSAHQQLALSNACGPDA